MVKAECEGGTSNLYASEVILTSSNVNFSTNDTTVWWPVDNLIGMNAGNFNYPYYTSNVPASDYFESVYTAPTGYSIAEVGGGDAGNMESTTANSGANTIINLNGWDGTNLVSSTGLYHDTGNDVAPFSIPIPLGVTSVGIETSFVNAWTVYASANGFSANSDVVLYPSGGVDSASGTFQSDPVQIDVTSATCTTNSNGYCITGDPETLNGTVSFNGSPIQANLSFNVLGVDNPYTYYPSVANGTAVSDYNGNVGDFSITYTVSTSYPSTASNGSQYMYDYTVSGDGGDNFSGSEY